MRRRKDGEGNYVGLILMIQYETRLAAAVAAVIESVVVAAAAAVVVIAVIYHQLNVSVDAL